MIGIIAGSGQLPIDISTSLSQQNIPHVLICLNGLIVSSNPTLQAKIGHVGETLAFLKRHEVKTLIIAGKIERPTSLWSLSLDWKGLKWAKRLSSSFHKGDDALLRTLVTLFEEEGFQVDSPDTYLPRLHIEPGIPTLAKPTEEEIESIRIGSQLLDTLSPYDIGQAVVMSNQRIIGIEGPEGTEALIKRCAPFINSSGILIKKAKTNQSMLIDRPTIGPNTIDQLIKHGYKGLTFEASTTQTLDIDNIIKKSNDTEIWIWAF